MNKSPKDRIIVSRYSKKSTVKRWLHCCLFILVFASCKNNEAKIDFADQFKKIDSVKASVKSGDLIVRNGNDEVSLATRKFNRKDTTYSHCGIIQIENDTVFVYHALGGSYNPSQKLMRQVLDSFCNPVEVDKFAIYRYSFPDEQKSALAEIIKEHYKNQLPFDMFFNYESDDTMYCSEFVFKSINRATKNYFIQFLPPSNPVYITVDDLYLNPSATLIKKIIF